MYYGAQYYRPPFPRKEFWEKDLKNIKELGFNIIKLWAVWNDVERKEGVFTFDELDELVEMAKGYGLDVMINTIVEGAPYWLYEKYPDCFYESVKGEKITPGGPANIPTGGWPGLCMDHPEAAEAICRFMKETSAHFKDCENVVIIDVWNEPHLEPMYDYPSELLCACKASNAEFRKWLKVRYQTLENLNKAWYRRYSDWNQIVPPPRFGTYPDMMDWRRFWLYNLRRWLEEKVAAARAGAPNKLIQTHCASACYMGAVGNGALGTELADEFLLAEPVDLFGLSSFPAWLMGNTREEHFLAHMINLDIISAASCGKTFYQVELQGGAGKPDVLGHVTPDKYDMRVWNWNIIAAGGKGAVYWQYAYEPAGVESPGFGLTGFEHENTERSLEAGRCARYFQKKGLDEAASVLPMNGICISRNASLFLFAAERQEKMYADSLLGAYKVCADAGIPVRFVHTDYLENAWDEGLRVLYVPMAIALSKKEQDDILAFAEKGGKVVVEAAAGFYDERGEMDVRTSLLKCVFEAEDFSILYQENAERGKKAIMDRDGRLVCKGVSYVQTMAIHKGDALGFVEDASEEAEESAERDGMPENVGKSKETEGNKRCAYARSPYGKGCVEWIGTYPAMMAKREADEACTAFVQNVFVSKGYDMLQELEAEGLIVRMLHKSADAEALCNGEKYILVAVNQHAEERNVMVKVQREVFEAAVPGYDGVLLELSSEACEKALTGASNKEEKKNGC